jgi:hypothetical protein
MNLDQLPSVDDMAGALESGRRRLARVDLDGFQESARSAARTALPHRWSRPKPRPRWPIVGAVLVIGTVIVGLLFLLPTMRRTAASEGGTERSESGREPGTRPDVVPESTTEDWAKDNFAPLADRDVAPATMKEMIDA